MKGSHVSQGKPDVCVQCCRLGWMTCVCSESAFVHHDSWVTFNFHQPQTFSISLCCFFVTHVFPPLPNFKSSDGALLALPFIFHNFHCPSPSVLLRERIILEQRDLCAARIALPACKECSYDVYLARWADYTNIMWCLFSSATILHVKKTRSILVSQIICNSYLELSLCFVVISIL